MIWDIIVPIMLLIAVHVVFKGIISIITEEKDGNLDD